MAEFHDFEHVEEVTQPAGPAPAPLVVVHYRRRGWWWIPPALVLGAAVGAAWSGYFRPAEPPHLPPIRPAGLLAESAAGGPAGAEARTLALNVRAIPAPPPEPAAAEPPEPEPEPVPAPDPPIARDEPAGPAPDLVREEPEPALESQADPESESEAARAHAEAETREAFAAIRREAEARREDLAERERLREELPAIERRAREEARRAEALRGRAFRDGIRELLRQKGDDAGPDISALAVQFHTPTPPEVAHAVERELRARAAKLGRSGRIAVCRKHGMPETEILGRLVQEQRSRMPHRNGPSSTNEAIVRAARQLVGWTSTRSSVAASSPASAKILTSRPR